MKSFLEHINEEKGGTSVIDNDYEMMDLNNEDHIKKLNAFVGAIGMREYLVLDKAIDELREKLSRVGIQFGDVSITEDNGTISVPLVKHGGVYGKDLDTPADEVVNETQSGRSLVLTYEKTSNNTCKVFAKIT